MSLYSKVRENRPIANGDVGRLIQTIHTTARLSRADRSKHKSDKRNLEEQKKREKLSEHLKVIAEDLKLGTVSVQPWGLAHLLTSFGVIGEWDVGIELWKDLSAESSQCREVARSSPVAGAVIELMVKTDTPFETIQTIYNQAKASGESCNCDIALVGALLKYGHNTDALDLFSQVLRTYPDQENGLSRVHDKFIGDCTDIETSLNFFYEGIRGDTPYKAISHPSKVKDLMQKLWNKERDLDHLETVWKDYIESLSPSKPEWRFITTVNFFMKAFFENYPVPTPEAIKRFQGIIQFYLDTRVEITPIFLNTVLTAVQPWGDKDVVLTLINGFKTHKLTEDEVSHRIILNSLQNIDVDPQFINDRWDKLASTRSKLTQFDFVALLRACSSPDRERIFSSIFESLLQENKVTDDALFGISQTLIYGSMKNKRHFFDALLRKNHITISKNGKITRLSSHPDTFSN